MSTTDPDQEGKRANLLIIGPLPPPYGGVANFILNIERQEMVRSKYDVRLFRTGKTRNDTPAAVQILIDGVHFLKFMFGGGYRTADVIHLHTSAYWSLLRNMPYVFLIKRASNAKLLIHMHDGTFERFYRGSPPLLQRLVRSMFRAGDQVVVTSPSWIKLMSEVCGESAKIIPLPNGFDPSIFHPSGREEGRVALGLPSGKKVLLAVGYLEEVKGYEFLIRALKVVLSARDDVVVNIIGTGSLKKQLSGLAADLGVEENISFVESRKTPEEVALWMSASDLFVISSLNEGNPTVMFESLGCGRPLVATRVGGIPDVITSNELGRLCDPADPEGLAQCILAALDSPWDEDRIYKYAQRFAWENITSELMGIYQQMLDDDE